MTRSEHAVELSRHGQTRIHDFNSVEEQALDPGDFIVIDGVDNTKP
ncbi:MAG: hypothetical protein IPP94_16860 [Ignavibacteria bacterium]|nr:hypothetical protein [Ignavibacteria bacterium]